MKFRHLIWILIFCSFMIGCTSSPVVYDNILDTFRYKPESEWDYVKDLGPTDIPLETSSK